MHTKHLLGFFPLFLLLSLFQTSIVFYKVYFSKSTIPSVYSLLSALLCCTSICDGIFLQFLVAHGFRNLNRCISTTVTTGVTCLCAAGSPVPRPHGSGHQSSLPQLTSKLPASQVTSKFNLPVTSRPISRPHSS